jgi:hypothetical protein
VTEKKGGSARRALQRGSRRVQPGGETLGGETPATGSARTGSARTGSARTGSARTGREGTKRITVDLPRSEHKFLRDFAYDNDTDGMRVVRALLLELRDDPGLSPRVLARMGEL